jgi:hypothetical protein
VYREEDSMEERSVKMRRKETIQGLATGLTWQSWRYVVGRTCLSLQTWSWGTLVLGSPKAPESSNIFNYPSKKDKV